MGDEGIADVPQRAPSAIRAVERVAIAVAREVELERMVSAVLDQTMDTLHARAAYIFFTDTESRELRLIGHRNLPPNLVERIRRIPLDTPSLAVRAAATQQIQVIEDASQIDPDLSLARELLQGTESQSLLSVPLVAAGRLVGVLNYTLPQPHHFSSHELTAMRTVAEIFAVGLANSRVYDERKRAEGQFRRLLEAAPDAILIVDQGGRITLANGQAETMFGYPREELLGQPIEILLPERFREQHVGHRDGYHARPHTRPMGVGFELLGRRKNGLEFPVEISLSPLQTEGGQLVTSIIRDVTDRKRVEQRLKRQAEELARSNSELQLFAYVASHDLQEPLRMVASYTQLLGRRYRGKLDEDADTFIEFAVDGATRMQELINDLLAYSRVGTQGQEFLPTDINAVFDRVVTDLRTAIVDAGAGVTRTDLPTVSVDASQIGPLLQNLIGNGLKFRGAETPHVHVSAELVETEWRFSVRDNGIGIEPQYAERIFVMFQRLHGKSEYPGTGIGLAICKKIVDRHGGRIWVESRPGEGSTFYFTIPNRPT